MASLVQANDNITADARRQVHLGLEIELDTDHEAGALELALIVSCALEERA